MKSKLVLVSAIILALVVFAGCPGTSEPDTFQAGEVTVPAAEAVTVADLTASGASESFVVTSPAGITEILNSISGDALMENFSEVFGSTETSSIPTEPVSPLMKQSLSKVFSVITRTTIAPRSITDDIESDFTDLQTKLENFPTSKRLNKTVSYTNQTVGECFKLVTLNGAVNASLETTDGKALDTNSGSNFKNFAANGNVSIVLSALPGSIPADSDIKDLKVNLNAAANISCNSRADSAGYRVPTNLIVGTAQSMNVGITINNGTHGGIILFSFSSNSLVTIEDLSTMDEMPSASTIAPSVAITVSVYADDGTQIYTKSYANIDEFVEDFSVTGIEE